VALPGTHSYWPGKLPTMTEDAQLPIGPYEDIVTSALEEQMASLTEALIAKTRELADLEAPDRFALHVASAVRRALTAHHRATGAGGDRPQAP
jgi:hypothetical protein